MFINRRTWPLDSADGSEVVEVNDEPRTWSLVLVITGGVCIPASELAHHTCCCHGGDLGSASGTEAGLRRLKTASRYSIQINYIIRSIPESTTTTDN